MKIGLTGGIGCGKSTALLAFQKNNFATLSADAIGHEILRSAHAREFVVAEFGENCVRENEIDRGALAKIVFENPAARERLEKFLHPKIEAEWRARANAGADVVVEIPLLFEKNYETEFDAVVCVACSRETQLSRLENRGLPREQARARIDAQLPIEEKIRRADAVVFNDGDTHFLEFQISKISENLRTKKNANANARASQN